ncbi:major facilitator superfamily domain-containing protein [Sordaria brevicollis]|uniref:Major facilitator superfamily domain-containing protein n=1 Tax=Sordaria brevicollis TaxID=83679 RepID=A0AAE0UBX5_SORBR|nr:major facilitator superfamily domain-containing protein [Sordaria brevicollis]
MDDQRETEDQQPRPQSPSPAENPNAHEQRTDRDNQQVRFEELPKLGDNSVVINVENGNIPVSRGPPAPQRELPFKGFMYLCLGVGFGLFLSMLDTTIVATSLYEIGLEFDKMDAVNWVALAYTLAYVGCVILFAKVSDVVGRKTAFLAAYALFVFFSIGCAGAQTFTQLVVCRAFQGVGASGLYGLAIIILTEVTPRRWKHSIGPLIGVILAAAGVLGPILGGALTEKLGWRWIFWINIFGLAAGIIFWFAWPQPEYLPAYQRRSLWECDLVGTLFLTAGSVLITYAFQSVRETSGWNNRLFIAPLTAGFGCLIILLFWPLIVDKTTLRDKTTTVIPVVLLKNHVYVLVAVSTGLLGFGYIMTLYVFPLQFRIVNGYSALEASLLLLPMLVCAALGSMLAPMLSIKRNVLSWTIAAGGLFTTLGTALSAANAASSHRFGTTLYAAYVGLVGLGFGLSAAAATALAVAETPIYVSATAQGLVALLRVWGGSIGIAVSGAVLGTTQGPSSTPLSADHYTKALKTSMIIASSMAALGTICAFCAVRGKRPTLAEMMRKREFEEARRQAELARKREAERREQQEPSSTLPV